MRPHAPVATARGRLPPMSSPRTARNSSSRTRASPPGQRLGDVRWRRFRRGCWWTRSIAKHARSPHSRALMAAYSARARARPRCRSTARVVRGWESGWPIACMPAQRVGCGAIATRSLRCWRRSRFWSSAATHARPRSTTPRPPMHSARFAVGFAFRMRGGKTPCPSQLTSQPATVPSSRGGRLHRDCVVVARRNAGRSRAQPWMRPAQAGPRQTERADEPACLKGMARHGPTCGTSLRSTRCGRCGRRWSDPSAGSARASR